MSAGAAALSVSNFFFWTQSGYFNGAAAEMPLLHTWSLAIEEQFYIFLPPYLLLMRRWTGWPWISIIAPVVVVSFAMGIVTTDRAPGAAFYFPFGRMWELGVGALAAAWPASFSMRNGHRWREAIAIAGLVMILCAITLYSENTKFPGIAAALPCLGTVMILQANRGYRTRLGMVLS